MICRTISFAILCAALLGSTARAQTASQTFVLNPGWSAIHVKIDPSGDRAPGQLFGDGALDYDRGAHPSGVYVAAIWNWRPDENQREFLQVPGDLAPGSAGWLAYLNDPDDPAGSNIATNLRAIQGNQAYLVKLEGSTPVEVTISGSPVPARIRWKPDAFHLTGLPVEAGSALTFEGFFAGSSAHANPIVYSLALDGGSGQWEWQMIDPAVATIDPNVSYWIHSDQGSRYAGTLAVELPQVDRVEFGSKMPEQTIRIRNLGPTSKTIDVSALSPSDTDDVLFVRDFDLDAEVPWLPLPLSSVELGPPGSASPPSFVDVRLGVKRAAFDEASEFDAILSVTDDIGSEFVAPVTAAREVSAGYSHAGLWIGTVTVENVTGANSYLRGCFTCPLDDPATEEREDDCPVKGLPNWTGYIGVPVGPDTGVCHELVHGCGDCAAQGGGEQRCLETCIPDGECLTAVDYCTDTFPPEFTDPPGPVSSCGGWGRACMNGSLPMTTGLPQVAGFGTPVPVDPDSPFRFRVLLHVDAAGNTTLLKDVIQLRDRDGRPSVLLTDDRRVHLFEPMTLRDGEPVGRRLSTVAYDFEGTKLSMWVAQGFGVPGGLATAFIEIPDSTNPFRHKFHPDHRFIEDDPATPENEEKRVRIQREMQFQFGDPDLDDLGAGETSLEGIYRELVTGLHKNIIYSNGHFSLRQVTKIPELDPAVNP